MGALNLKALTSPLICEYKTINECNVSRFFNEIRKVYLEYNQKIHIILDGAGYHRSQLVKDWAEVINIRLHYLPPYFVPHSQNRSPQSAADGAKGRWSHNGLCAGRQYR